MPPKRTSDIQRPILGDAHFEQEGYEPAGNENRVIEAIIYARGHREPTRQFLFVPRESYYRFFSYPISRKVRDAEYLAFNCYTGDFEHSRPTNLEGRGSFMLYLQTSKTRNRCPGIDNWIERVYTSSALELGNLGLEMKEVESPPSEGRPAEIEDIGEILVPDSDAEVQ
ncbi:hypothetical protein B0H10DRAFT_1956194 [Mycena sp. CBHHK59/15]|nr:hypothetical protein B0H10DRAFT_1956194 [Mycena sp. CBHHK59/15]